MSLDELKENECGVEVSSYTPTNLRYAFLELQLVNTKGEVEGVGFGKPYRGLLYNSITTTFLTLFTNAPGRVQGVFKCLDDNWEVEADLNLKRGINYLSIEGLKLPLVPTKPKVIATRKIDFGDPYTNSDLSK